MSADALLAEILANPDEDIPRLIYADWRFDEKPQVLDAISHDCSAGIGVASSSAGSGEEGAAGACP